MANYNTLKKSDLKDLCRERGITGCSKKNKTRLMNDLHEWDVLNNTRVEPAIQKPSDALVDTPAIASKKLIRDQTSDLNEPKKTTWGSIKSFFSKKAESLKSTILGKKKESVKSAGSNLISKVKSKLESLKSKEPVKSVKSAITKLFRRKRKTPDITVRYSEIRKNTDSLDRSENEDSLDRSENEDSSDRGINRIKIQETNSALEGFAKRYTIDGWEGVYVGPFLDMVEPHVVDFLAKNRQKKVYLFLTCIMVRPHIKTGEEEPAMAIFTQILK